MFELPPGPAVSCTLRPGIVRRTSACERGVKAITASWLICETEIEESRADLPLAAAVTTIGPMSATLSPGAPASGAASVADAGACAASWAWIGVAKRAPASATSDALAR
jgi:hypothetical protein